MTEITFNLENIVDYITDMVEYNVNVKRVFDVEVKDIDTLMNEIYVEFKKEFCLYFKTAEDVERFKSDHDSVYWVSEPDAEHPVAYRFTNDDSMNIDYSEHKNLVTII